MRPAAFSPGEAPSSGTHGGIVCNVAPSPHIVHCLSNVTNKRRGPGNHHDTDPDNPALPLVSMASRTCTKPYEKLRAGTPVTKIKGASERVDPAGAGTQIANLKHTDTPVRVHWEGKDWVDTERRKFGAILGDGAKTGVNTSLNPGTVLGVDARVAAGTTVTGWVPDGEFVTDTTPRA